MYFIFINAIIKIIILGLIGLRILFNDFFLIIADLNIINVIFFFIIFIKTVKSGQYEDTYTPSVRMLFDDELVTESDKDKQKNSQSTK